MSTVLTRPPAVVDRPGWIPPEITDGWDTKTPETPRQRRLFRPTMLGEFSR